MLPCERMNWNLEKSTIARQKTLIQCGAQWLVVWEVETLTTQTEVEMIINTDLDSTPIPSSTLPFFFLREAKRDTKKNSLSTDCEGQHFIWVDNVWNVFPEKGYSHPLLPSFLLLPIWIQTVLSPWSRRQLEGLQSANYKLSIHNCSGLSYYSYRA